VRDDEFPADDIAVLRDRMMVHDDAVGIVMEGRWCGSLFLKQVAENEPDMADGLLAAADCYKIEYDLMCKAWELVGGIGRDDAKVRKLAEPDVRRHMVPLIREARDRDAEAANLIEQALAR
jgi:hypothetical protein